MNSKAFSTAVSRKRQRGWMAKPGVQPLLRALQLFGGSAEGGRAPSRAAAVTDLSCAAKRPRRREALSGAAVPWRPLAAAWRLAADGGGRSHVSQPGGGPYQVLLQGGEGGGSCCRRGPLCANGLSAGGDGGRTEVSSRLVAAAARCHRFSPHSPPVPLPLRAGRIVRPCQHGRHHEESGECWRWDFPALPGSLCSVPVCGPGSRSWARWAVSPQRRSHPGPCEALPVPVPSVALGAGGPVRN